MRLDTDGHFEFCQPLDVIGSNHLSMLDAMG